MKPTHAITKNGLIAISFLITSAVSADTLPTFGTSYQSGTFDPVNSDDFISYVITGQGDIATAYSTYAADTTTDSEFAYAESGARFNSTLTRAGTTTTIDTVRAIAYEMSFEIDEEFTPDFIPFTIDWTLKNYLSSETVDFSALSGVVNEQQSALSGIFIGNENQTLLNTTYSEHGELSQTSSFLWDTSWGNARIGLLARSTVSLTALTTFSIAAPFDAYTSQVKSYADPIIRIDSNWEHADKVSLTFNYPTLRQDQTVSLSAVPVPAAIWLFIPALLGFIGLRRKQKA
jgi:hypothetical protein